MTIEEIELMPGVVLTAVHTDKFKNSYWSMQLFTPLRKETAAMNALLPRVLRRGTARLPDLCSLSAELDDLYGGIIEPVVSKCGDMQVIGFSGSFLDDAFVPDETPVLEKAAALLGELLLHPSTKNGRLRQDYIRSEQENLLRQIESVRDDKLAYAKKRLIDIMYEGTCYAVGPYGTADDVRKINQLKLFAQYQKLLEKSSIELYYCGTASAKKVELAWRKALMGLPRSSDFYKIETDASRLARDQVQELCEQMEVGQGKLEMGFQLGFGLNDELFPALLVANALFGGTTTSRLFMNVRERQGLCYYASSSLARLKGVMIVSCGVDPVNAEVAKTEILHQLTEIQKGAFSDDELEAARRSVVRELQTSLDEQGSLNARWLIQRAAGLPFDAESLTFRVEDITKEAVVAAAMEIQLDSVYFLANQEEKGESAL